VSIAERPADIGHVMPLLRLRDLHVIGGAWQVG
jgi:hypothetical protein